MRDPRRRRTRRTLTVRTPGLVLRRSRHGRSMAGEARIMEYVRQHGYPVPAVEQVSDDGTELVMQRIDGPSTGAR
jgi:tRNA A-37 threonylcarbamoyl transferase component Bud32